MKLRDLQVSRGKRLILTGPSGCGKTTFIKILAGILPADSGKIVIDKLDLTSYSQKELQDLRLMKIGLVFQEFELLEYLSVIDNVLLPLRINPVLSLTDESKDRALLLLDKVGLRDKAGRYPRKLSQGERQRVAICRSMIANPDLLLYDEPTANLDARNRDIILELIIEYCRENHATLLMVSHDREIFPSFDEILYMNELQTASDE